MSFRPKIEGKFPDFISLTRIMPSYLLRGGKGGRVNCSCLHRGGMGGGADWNYLDSAFMHSIAMYAIVYISKIPSVQC